MKVYFCRHGESEANRLHIISNRHLDHHLTGIGKFQAATLAERLQRSLVSKIFTSPLLRALETAEIVSSALGVPFIVTDALREYDCGELEGRGDQWAWDEHQRWVDLWLGNREREKGPKGGESFNDIVKRFIPYVDKLVYANRDDNSEFVLIGHGGTYLFGLPFVLANVDTGFIIRHGFGNAMKISAGIRDDRLVCLAWGDEELVE